MSVPSPTASGPSSLERTDDEHHGRSDPLRNGETASELRVTQAHNQPVAALNAAYDVVDDPTAPLDPKPTLPSHHDFSVSRAALNSPSSPMLLNRLPIRSGQARAESLEDFLRAVPGPSANASTSENNTEIAHRPQQERQIRVSRTSSSRDWKNISQREHHTPYGMRRENSMRTSPGSSSSSTRNNDRLQDIAHTDSRFDPVETRNRSLDSRSGNASRPRWQPDSEVTVCPVCNSQFGFFNRKHHCRKCGRVVCNACSPHRITIPFPYIVQPPNAEDIIPAVALSNALDNRGGMKVRLCNPCVPDPNIAPPQLPTPLPPSYSTDVRSHDPPQPRGARSSAGVVNTQTISSSLPGSIPRSERAGVNVGRNLREHLASIPPRSGHHSRHQSLSSLPTSTGSQYHSTDVRMMLNSSATRRDQALPPTPRIAEEDECPICHRELPVRTLPDFEDARAAHVMRCIDEQIAVHGGRPAPPDTHTSPPQQIPSTVESPQASSTIPTRHSSLSQQTAASSQPPTAATQSALSNLRYYLPTTATLLPHPSLPLPASTTPQIPNTPEARMRAREEAHAAVVLGHARSPSGEQSSSPGRRTGMFPYTATEKDCVDDAECTICLEEFEVGVAMARLECLCRFHRKCIQEWFQNGHAGRCPVHQHDGYGY